VDIVLQTRIGKHAKQGKPCDARSGRVPRPFANPYVAAERGFVDAVFTPAKRATPDSKLWKCWINKRDKKPAKKHGNIPL